MDYPLERTVDDTPKICVRRIKAGSLFVLVAAGVCSVFIPLFIFFGVLALLGCQTIHVNGHPVFGIAGLIAALFMAPIFSFIFTVIVWLALYIGIRICGSFKPFTIRYVADDTPKA
jgi:hypothetical protein